MAYAASCDRAHGLAQRVRPRPPTFVRPLRYFFPCFGTTVSSSGAGTVARAWPYALTTLDAHGAGRALDVWIAASRLAAFRSGIFVLGDLLDLLLRDLADLVLVRLAASPSRSPAALSSRIAAGGVLVMNV